VCSENCFFLVATDNDDKFVCTLSGLTWGKQVTNGSYDQRNHLDHPATVVSYKSSKRKVSEPSDFRYELYSCAVRMLYKLLHKKSRTEIEESKLVKARKAALRTEAIRIRECRASGACVNLSNVMHASWTDLERAGGGTRVTEVTDKRVNTLANTFCMLYERFIYPYAEVVSKKPTKEYFVTACAYLFAEGIGTFSDTLLSTHVPDTKNLKHYGLQVGRVTSAKRYVKESFVYYKKQKQMLMKD
jgi:hypothetical protein